ncbi:PA3715 family protein [Paraburkholderia bannensis]|uniref:hypothetical protein n=1 Tax=Paraburkholderia bannensis TaxID=765414 RepID=UPI000480BD9F|nr:hypothetical protein [Paraburkholderia bannensis]
MRTFLPLAFALVATLSNPARASEEQPCSDDVVAAVAQWAGVNGSLGPWGNGDGMLAAASCKAMPDAPDTTIAAVALDTNHVGPSSGDGNVTQVVALVKGGQVLAATRSTIEQDVLTQVGGYRIDTAPYRLSPDVRAFGVIFDSSARGPSCADAAADHELTLFVREGRTLRPVFGTNLYGWVNIDPNSCGAGLEAEHDADASMTIAVEKTISHGFADLALSARVTRNEQKSQQRIETTKYTKRIVLHYDGKTYGINMFRDFWYPADSVMKRSK